MLGKFFPLFYLLFCLSVMIYSITTFNEWGEGTQIEPAKSYVTTVRSYLSYKTSTDPNRVNDYLYLNMTLSYSQQFKQTAEQPPKQSEL